MHCMHFSNVVHKIIFQSSSILLQYELHSYKRMAVFLIQSTIWTILFRFSSLRLQWIHSKKMTRGSSQQIKCTISWRSFFCGHCLHRADDIIWAEWITPMMRLALRMCKAGEVQGCESVIYNNIMRLKTTICISLLWNWFRSSPPCQWIRKMRFQ